MTKMIKMSLIAAVAVTGMTSTVCAQPLEDAIKGVDVSGQLRYRYDDKALDKATGTDSNYQTNEYTAKIALKSKVNDIVTANVQVEARGVTGTTSVAAVASDALTTQSAGNAHATSDIVGDRDVNLVVTKANFAANLGFATVVAGKQSVPSPFVDGNAATDDTTRGTGAVALIPAGPVTIAAGHFMNFQSAQDTDTSALKDTSIYSGSSIDAAAVLGTVAGVNFDAWYVNVAGRTGDAVANEVTGKSLGLNTTIAGVNFDARHSTKTEATKKDSGLTKLVASTKVGPVSLVAGYAVTPKDNVNVTIDTDNDAKVGFRLWQASTEKLNDSKAYLVGASMDLMDNVNLDVKYVKADATKSTTEDVEVTELLIGATYKMSKNFGVHARYSMMDTKYSARTVDEKSNKGRLELKYTF